MTKVLVQTQVVLLTNQRTIFWFPVDLMCFWRHCQYGGEDEYYVQVRETGNMTQENIHSEQTTERTQDREHWVHT